MDRIDKVCSLLRNSKNTIVLTGAGISTDSGIPDFRSADNGIWNKIDPMEALSSKVLINNPKKFYSQGYQLLDNMTGFKPNDGHKALRELEKRGLVDYLITQNIDDLHYKAGSEKVFEVHGNIRTGSCIKCGREVKLDVITDKVNRGEIPPKCDICNGILRPDVVMFGDRLPEDFNKAWQLADGCELLIVVGSSLSVAPVNFLPKLAKKLVIINLEPTPFDNIAEVVINDNCSLVLNEILNKIDKVE
ncbi:SIR2 family NAD-dependent protein deacylase [Dethiothermospora halolimnae]|uniref:SIR2 family NAD-dependent protein deacylase n=1 Tax=Dethiothermospora halolimnae TaxID=3114390 RepID=UPI003CCC1420